MVVGGSSVVVVVGGPPPPLHEKTGFVSKAKTKTISIIARKLLSY